MIDAPFRDRDAVARLCAEIARFDPGRPVRVMHVCGTHENAICEFGLRDLLPSWLKVIAGPGCPVCVCPAAEIDLCARLALDRQQRRLLGEEQHPLLAPGDEQTDRGVADQKQGGDAQQHGQKGEGHGDRKPSGI